MTAALGPTKEGRFLLPGEGGKPADIFIPRWTAGKDAALDVTVVNPLQDALVQEAAATPGHALSVAHKRKLDKSWEACRQQGIEFIPIAADSLPLYLRNMTKCSVEIFKEELDKYLMMIPDEPSVPGLTPSASTPDARPSNSLLHQRPMQPGREERRGRTRPGA